MSCHVIMWLIPTANPVIADQHDWSTYDGDNTTDESILLPIDMRFNDGHRLSIMVYRWDFDDFLWKQLEVIYKNFKHTDADISDRKFNCFDNTNQKEDAGLI